MSSKPTTVPIFDTNGTNMVAPSGSRISDGYPTNAIPTSAEFNYHLHWQGLWTKWLDDGDCTFHNLTASGDAHVDGDFSVDQDVAIAGDAAVSGSLTVTHDVHYAEEHRSTTRYQAVPFRAGHGTNANASGSCGFSSSGTTWTWDSDGFGDQGTQAIGASLYIVNAASTSITITIYLCSVAGTLAVEHAHTITSPASNNLYQWTWPAVNTTNDQQGWLVRVQGLVSGDIIGGARLGLIRP